MKIPGRQWRGRKSHGASLGARAPLRHCAEVQTRPAQGSFDYAFGVAPANVPRGPEQKADQTPTFR
jgi:hypothetical protein